eukprot:CAMPEP_0177665240 /NCGR_PEP_ID=MMETSP0447-20121125/20946_1 /TAXON_ID=0 /ORGANISM="Stygamoeba regulata, Strain BSH-02190019" /LENGTH=307 /DNA_ID=CAMNT_0019171315 /DNA_START=66 /DNA_END=989 /DNA_ORIENTATION=-
MGKRKRNKEERAEEKTKEGKSSRRKAKHDGSAEGSSSVSTKQSAGSTSSSGKKSTKHSRSGDSSNSRAKKKTKRSKSVSAADDENEGAIPSSLSNSASSTSSSSKTIASSSSSSVSSSSSSSSSSSRTSAPSPSLATGSIQVPCVQLSNIPSKEVTLSYSRVPVSASNATNATGSQSSAASSSTSSSSSSSSSTSSSRSDNLERTVGFFIPDLIPMMFGFGDSPQPRADTAELLERLVYDYLEDVTKTCVEVARTRGARIPNEKDLLFVLRKDPTKYHRVHHLLRMNEELKASRKALNPTDFTAFTI